MAFKKKIRLTFGIGLTLCVAVIVWRGSLQPSNNRQWQPPLQILAEPIIEGERLTIRGVRNFSWKSSTEFEEKWESRTFDLGKLESVDLVLEPFAYSSLMAHTMMSFDFGDDGRLVLSIEARKEVGEDYGPVAGGLNQFELIYLFLDERDAYGNRVHQGHELYTFPVRAKPLQLRAFLLSLLSSADNLRSQAQFYHIIRHNCTTTWIQHSDMVSRKPIGLRLESILNGLIVELLVKRGAIDTDLSYEESKKAFRIDNKVLEFIESDHFSELIREGQPR